MASASHLALKLLLLLLLLGVAAVSAAVPPSKRFVYVNSGQVSDYASEYFSDFITTDIFTFPFRVCFYNSTPDAHYLAIRMGFHRSTSPFRWLWEANRDHPVHTNATLSFGADGNLVLADADGTVAWQTGTANKGVVGLELLPNGNLVLHDSRGRFVWQSFDHPTDSLLVGQSLRLGGPTSLTARTAERDGSNGPYSLVLEPKRFAMYVKAATKSLIYFDWNQDIMELRLNPDETVTSVVFESTQNEDYPQGSDLSLHAFTKYKSGDTSENLYKMAMTKFNATLSFLRLDLDGNLRIYSFVYGVDINAWDMSFTLFRRGGLVDECGLPARCGKLGLCENSQCVACPQPKGLFGWSSSCAPPPQPPCKPGRPASYYKVVGVEHFSSNYNDGQGPVTEAACRDLCTKDCRCQGFFYRAESSRCLVVPLLGSITKVDNSSHVAYIKK